MTISTVEIRWSTARKERFYIYPSFASPRWRWIASSIFVKTKLKVKCVISSLFITTNFKVYCVITKLKVYFVITVVIKVPWFLSRLINQIHYTIDTYILHNHHTYYLSQLYIAVNDVIIKLRKEWYILKCIYTRLFYNM